MGIRKDEGPVCLAQSEELLQLRSGLGRIADEQRLALPVEPEVLVESGLIEIAIDLEGRLTRPGIHHEANLRSATSFLAHLSPDGAERQIDVAVSHAVR